ncbi:dimethylaniline monooxygenase [Coleophoma cylindrospora]|uniref:Dimethylaniline monooxygenase n=1 Tax=Coleophoma cylindrospora TaxID=1849047 RepID=A0A3D8RZH8_9HELO|nr:dimethylaniline monooxygenase [Coleophoma cylindrospora]
MAIKLEEQSVKILIIGAGVGGLCAAKTYLELAPESNVVLLDAKRTLGGVWAAESCYDGLKTNNLLGSYEFTDFPLDEKYGVKPGQHIPGITLHKYFTDFAEHYDIARRIQLNTRVFEAEKLETGGWKILAQRVNVDGSTTDIRYTCEKLIVSTGLSSTPNPICIPGQQDFDKIIVPHGELTQHSPALIKDPAIETVTVLGGSKTGYDCVHLFASEGKKVEWIIRKSGAGPVWMTEGYVTLGPFRIMLERLATTRFLTWFSPCIWGDADGFGGVRKFLNRTRLGRYLMHNFWEKLRWDVVDGNGYRKDPALAGLEPDERWRNTDLNDNEKKLTMPSMFWTARVGILNYTTDIHQYLRSGQVTIHRKDISHLSEAGTIHFADETNVQTDALIAITGWKLASTIKYKPDGLDASIGIPSANHTADEKTFWHNLDSKADAEIFRQFPYLRQAPKKELPLQQPVSPFRLYRGIAPPGLTAQGDHSLIFLKMVASTSNMIVAEMQALWAYAYLEGKLDINKKDVYWQTALLSRFGKRRYPCGFGAWYPEFVYDSIPYADMLLQDLGLGGRRKTSMLKEMFEGYTIHDYFGVRREWHKLQLQKKLA